MMLKEPQIEVVELDLRSSIVTASCSDGVTDGGTYCVDSYATSDCGQKMASTGSGSGSGS